MHEFLPIFMLEVAVTSDSPKVGQLLSKIKVVIKHFYLIMYSRPTRSPTDPDKEYTAHAH